MTKKEVSYFMDRMTDGGLFYLSHYLEDKCDCHIIYISPTNRLIYPKNEDKDNKKIITQLREKNPLDACEYDETMQCLYYTYFSNEYKDKLAFYPVNEDKVKKIKDVMEDIYFPVSHYLQGLYLAHSQVRSYNSDIVRKIFSSDSVCWKLYMKEQRIDNLSKYFVVVMRKDKFVQGGIWREGESYLTKMQAKYCNIDIKTFLLDEFVIQLFPAYYYPEYEWEGRYCDYLHREIESYTKEFGDSISAGIGGIYPAYKMHDSFIEAMSAHFFNVYSQECPKECYFEDLGILRMILKQNHESVYNKVAKKLKVIKQNDEVKSTDLYETLKALLINDFNLKTVAQKLHIHVNTIYYRKERLEEILKEDLSLIKTRMNYYYYVICYDLLEFLKQREFIE